MFFFGGGAACSVYVLCWPSLLLETVAADEGAAREGCTRNREERNWRKRDRQRALELAGWLTMGFGVQQGDIWAAWDEILDIAKRAGPGKEGVREKGGRENKIK